MIEFYDVVNQNYIDLCKSQTLNVKVKVELLDHYENALGEITTKVSDTGGSIDIKYNQGMRRTCDITISDINSEMIPNNEYSPFFVNKKFKIYVGLYKHNYRPYQDDVTFWFSQGIFITKDCDYDKKNKVLHLSGVDKFGLFTKDLNQHTLQETYHINADSELGKLISDIVTISMGNGMPTDPKAPIIHTSFVNQVLPYDIEKTANETIGDILVEIATAFNADIYYDTNGHLVFEPNIIDDYNRQAPVFEFNRDNSCLVDISLNFNYGDIVNQITVTGDNSDGAIYSSTAKNENPISSLRVSNIGIKAADIEETAMGYSDKRCSDYANYLLKKKMRMAIAGIISCTPLPHLDCNRVIKVYQNEDDVHETDFLLEEIQMPLSPEAYTLSVCNLQDLPLTCYTSMIPQSAWYTWVFVSGTNTVGKFVNSNDDTYAIVPAKINSRTVEAIGGGDTLEDGSSGGTSVLGLDIIENLEIEDGINIINDYAFYGCSNLISVTIPKSIISIGQKAFYKCTSLASITIPDSVVSIGSSAFYSCTSLESAIISDSVTSIGSEAFRICSSLTSLILGSNVTSIGSYAFYYCSKLKNIIISDKIKSNIIKNVETYAFYNCTNLEGIYISDISSWCSFNFAGSYSNPLTYAKNLYLNGVLVTNVDIPEYVTSIGAYVFYNSSSLTNITFPDSLTSIGTGAFYNCTNLENVYVSSITSWCSINFSDSSSNPLRYAKNLYINNKLVVEIIVPSNIITIGNYTFYHCTSLKSITIPDGVTNIGSSAFSGCTSLTSITLPNSVTKIDSSAFYNCTSLTGVTLGNSITSIGVQTFYKCSSLKSITIPDSVTSIGSDTFANCTSLGSAIIGNSVTSIGRDAFYKCSKLTSITIPNSVTSIGEHAFFSCKLLANIYYTGSEEQWEAIEKGTSWNYSMGGSVSGGTTIHYNYIL